MKLHAAGAVLIIAGILVAPRLFGDMVILKSGEAVQGEIVSEANGSIQLRVWNAARTISTMREYSTAEIREIQRETAEQKAQRAMMDAYLDSQRYKLAAASYEAAYYDQIVDGVFRKFLTAYPDSPYSDALKAKVAEWLAERDKVAAGALKWKGQWYSGEEAKRVAGEVRATQLISEADALVMQANFDAAITKYREALAVGALPAEMIEALGLRMDVAFQKWKTVFDNSTSIGSQIANCEAKSRQIQQQLEQAQGELAKLEEQKAIIESAVCVKRGYYLGHYYEAGHWISYYRGTRYDLGGTLPAIPTYAINGCKDKIKRLQASLSELDSQRAQLQIAANNLPQQIQRIDELARQCVYTVREAKVNAQRRAAAIATPATPTAPSLVPEVSSPTPPSIPTTAVEAATVTPPEPETRPIPQPAAASTSPPAAATAEPLPWWQAHWPMILGALAVGFVLSRIRFTRD